MVWPFRLVQTKKALCFWETPYIYPDTFVAACTYLNFVQTNSFDRQPPYLLLYFLIGNGGDRAENHTRLGLHIFYQLTDILGVNSVQGQVGDRPGLAHLHRLLWGVKKYQDPCLCTLLLYGDERKDAKRHLPCDINIHMWHLNQDVCEENYCWSLQLSQNKVLVSDTRVLPLPDKTPWEALIESRKFPLSEPREKAMPFLPVPTHMKTLEPLQSQNKASRWGGRRSTGRPTWSARRLLQPVSTSRVVSRTTICKQFATHIVSKWYFIHSASVTNIQYTQHISTQKVAESSAARIREGTWSSIGCEQF